MDGYLSKNVRKVFQKLDVDEEKTVKGYREETQNIVFSLKRTYSYIYSNREIVTKVMRVRRVSSCNKVVAPRGALFCNLMFHVVVP